MKNIKIKPDNQISPDTSKQRAFALLEGALLRCAGYQSLFLLKRILHYLSASFGLDCWLCIYPCSKLKISDHMQVNTNKIFEHITPQFP